MQENKQEKSPIKKRILQYLELKGISKYSFYKDSGVTRGVLDQDTGISEDNLAKFLSYAQDISPIWILTGKENIFVTKTPEKPYNENVGENVGEKVGFRKLQKIPTNERDIEVREQQVPVYESVTLQSLESLFSNTLKPNSYLSLPNLPKCDGAVRMWGDTMSPELQSGDLLVYKKVKDLRNGLFLGQIYLLSVELDGEEYIMVQYVEQSDVHESVKLVSKNERYPAKDVPLDSIKALAMIKASVRYRAI